MLARLIGIQIQCHRGLLLASATRPTGSAKSECLLAAVMPLNGVPLTLGALEKRSWLDLVFPRLVPVLPRCDANNVPVKDLMTKNLVFSFTHLSIKSKTTSCHFVAKKCKELMDVLRY